MTERTDRELLELAAKAAGYKFRVSREWHSLEGIEVFIPNSGPTEHLCWHRWNPLEDDGDALRLLAALCIEVMWHRREGRVVAFCGDPASPIVLESSRENRQGNLRRAIVRAAAEIGRAM